MKTITCRSCGHRVDYPECEEGLNHECPTCRRIAEADPLIYDDVKPKNNLR